ncbi:MAG: hypothetical protein IKX31_12060 [Muribaculaceae bacterium]|nr:hypothetical protein [Muribaculaceae bacterium]
MVESKNMQLERYTEYLERLANNNSSELFSNGGKEYARALMAVLLRHTRSETRLYSHGFKAELINKDPYWSALREYLSDEHKRLMVLVETDKYEQEAPMRLLRETKERRVDKNSIIVKVIRLEDRVRICKKFGDDHCNFGIFDNDKFRYEYDPEDYRAYGSFNRPDDCMIFTELFDSSFANSDVQII